MSTIRFVHPFFSLLILLMIPVAVLAVDNRPPICEAVIDGSGATGSVAGSAIDRGSQQSGIVSVELDPSSTNLTCTGCTPTPLEKSVGKIEFALGLANALDPFGQGSAIVTDGAGNSCRVGASFSPIAEGRVSNHPLLLDSIQMVKFYVVEGTATSAGVAIVATSPPGPDDIDCLPTCFEFAPGAVIMTIDSTIEGETEVAHDILGNNNVRLLFRRLADRCPLEDASESISDLIVDPRVKGGKGKEWSRVQYAAGRLVELCELPRKRVDADKDGFFIGENVPLEEADCNDSTAFVNPAATESCNGIDDDCNGSIDEVGCGTIEISAVLNITGGDGGSSGHEPLVGTEVRVYDVSSGSCADQSGGTPKTYSTIYGDGTFANPGCVAETSGGTDLTGEITFPVEPGVYIVIGRPAPPHDDKLIGATVGIVGEGEVATKQIQLVVDGDGNEVPSRTD